MKPNEREFGLFSNLWKSGSIWQDLRKFSLLFVEQEGVILPDVACKCAFQAGVCAMSFQHIEYKLRKDDFPSALYSIWCWNILL